MKHTPGPWTYEPHGDTTALYSGRDGYAHGLRLMNLDDGDANFEANARLIAAAPELLGALKSLAAYVEDLERALRVSGNEAIDAHGDMERARNAVSKAEG